MDEFYGRVMPAPPARIREEDFVPLAQLYGREARVFTEDWQEIGRAHGEIFSIIRPAATMVTVKELLNPKWRVEIDADAVLP